MITAGGKWKFRRTTSALKPACCSIVSSAKGGAVQQVRVLVVDDHDFVRESVTALLRLNPEIDVVGACADGAAAVRTFEALRPDVVLMDLSMPVMGGVEATRQLLSIDPDACVVVLTSARLTRDLDAAMAAGAIACIHKDADPKDIVEGVLAAARGSGSR
jgi:DNA-binding NarL/FixJ family response regulator